MKYLKMLGLAAVAAAALMAFAGAGTASADELCTTTANAENMCPTTPENKRITSIEASLVGSAKLEDTSHNVLDTCTVGAVKITNITEANGNKTGSSSITGESTAGDITWAPGGKGCTFTTNTIKGGVVHATHAEDEIEGKKVDTGTTITATEAEVTINTVLFGSCVYGVGTGIDLGTVAQGGNTLAINTTVNKTAGSAACPTTSVWNATYKVTNHNAVFYITN